MNISEIGIYKEDVAVRVTRPEMLDPTDRVIKFIPPAGVFHSTYESSPSGRWVIASVHEGEVTVTIVAGGINTDEYRVSPGFPLQHFVNIEGDLDVTVEALEKTGSKLELIVSSSPHSIVPPPEPDSVIINPSVNGTLDVDFFAGVITAMRDPRVNALVQTDFTSATPQAHFIESDPDFNGRPSIDFTGTTVDGYQNADTFSWLNGQADFTFYATLKIQDVANFSAVDINRIWSNLLSTAPQGGGFRFAVDAAFRPHMQGGTTSVTPWTGQNLNVEMAEKPSIFIVRYVAATKQVRMYWQGQWRESYTAVTTPTLSAVMTIAGGGTQPPFLSPFKAADMRWFNRAAPDSEMESYITSAIALYGIDNTPEPGFPLLQAALRFMRANRGWRVNDLFYDTRPEVASAYYFTPQGGASYLPDPNLKGSHVSFQFDGVAGYAIANGAWTETGGNIGTGVTIAMVVWESRIPGGSKPIFSQSAYAVAVGGLSVWLDYAAMDDTLHFEIDNGTGTNVLQIDAAGPISKFVPYLITVEFTKATKAGRTEVTNLLSGSTLTYPTTTAAALGTPANPAFLFSWLGAAPFLSGALAEITSLARPLTNDERAALKAYAMNRYAP